MKNCAVGFVAAILLLATQMAGYACELKGLKTNMSFVKTNNSGSASSIDGACMLIARGHLDFNDYRSACFAIESAFRDGEAHNSDAAQTIDGCQCEQIVDIACH
jgi:hypothetical protein